MKPKFIIIYWRFLDFDGTNFFIGGIETYIHKLTKITFKMGFDNHIYQYASKNFVRNFEHFKVHGVKTPTLNIIDKNNVNYLLKEIKAKVNNKNSIILFGTDEISKKIDNYTTISIQHGISWDKPSSYLTQKKFLMSGIGEKIRRYTLRKNALKYFENSTYKVCVDYNFLNWYRTFRNCDNKIKVIPNCTNLISKEELERKIENTSNESIKILFARRFEEFRGTRIVAIAAKELLDSYKNLQFTFAGEGNDYHFLENTFQNNNRVLIKKFKISEIPELNYEHDISLIPSLGSEGTSFSVAEAMGSATAVIASDTGGITNMIIDGYNGLLISPTKDELFKSMKSLIDNKNFRKKLIINAYNTSKYSFSNEVWEERWENHLLQIVKENNIEIKKI